MWTQELAKPIIRLSLQTLSFGNDYEKGWFNTIIFVLTASSGNVSNFPWVNMSRPAVGSKFLCVKDKQWQVPKQSPSQHSKLS